MLRGRAFGLEVCGTAALAGVLAPGRRPDVPPPCGRPCRFWLAEDRATLLADWPQGGSEPVVRHEPVPGVRPLDADRDGSGRWLLHAPGAGTCLVAADGSAVGCAPEGPPGAWARFVVGQGLPMAAVLQGLEPFHASAVVLEGRAVGFVGASYAGKTTLALALALGGATLLTDDVLALDLVGDALVAQPGPAVVNVRPETTLLLPELVGFGTEASHDDTGRRLSVPVAPAGLPLALLYWLDAGDGGPAPAFTPITPTLPMLLGAGFNFVVQEAARLERQLEVCARIVEQVTVVRAAIPAAVPPAELAAAVAADARARLRAWVAR